MRANDPNLPCLRHISERERADLIMQRLTAMSA